MLSLFLSFILFFLSFIHVTQKSFQLGVCTMLLNYDTTKGNIDVSQNSIFKNVILNVLNLFYSFIPNL